MAINIKTNEQCRELISSDKITVAVFYAEWAEQCQHILRVAQDLSSQGCFNRLQFINIAAEEFSEFSLHQKVEAVPTVIFFRNGTLIDRIDGTDAATLTSKCKKFASLEVNTGTPVKQTLEERLELLINKSKITIFMKGDRITPRCGFSKQIITIINETGIPYETFDILEDEEVRQGLKTYSDWPTYPQVYVNGELIGGLDIVKELLASGELLTTLNG